MNGIIRRLLIIAACGIWYVVDFLEGGPDYGSGQP